MSTKDDGAAPARNAEHRRWLIGIAISLLFGIFGAVMAVLSYSARAKSFAPRAAPVVAAPGAPGGDPDTAKHRHRKGNGHD